jgi:hypothetical protein
MVQDISCIITDEFYRTPDFSDCLLQHLRREIVACPPPDINKTLKISEAVAGTNRKIKCGIEGSITTMLNYLTDADGTRIFINIVPVTIVIWCNTIVIFFCQMAILSLLLKTSLLLHKDRKSDAISGSIFDSGRLGQLPISRQEVPGAAIKPPVSHPRHSL